ncbi:hypothetical protein SG34_024750 [Thalassomonas viridans]|uniref:Uncharacterized protein n=1 Tax=Thalassomonas viridans TaxID=137584 RepID=A0AAE9Z1V7_9GAMM|nr:hypothetical protein [Thalassomonas viridans]WDE04509.1 hypothetical protein SG34_024750 [Thalassomonas viridans]
MAKSNDMPEFHSVKVSLTENKPVPATGVSSFSAICNGTCTKNFAALTRKGGQYHV